MPRIFFLPALLVLVLLAAPLSQAREIIAVSDVHSKVSGGKNSISDLARMAKERGVDVVILTDHTRVAMSYGLFPFRHVLRVRKERPSVQRYGPEKYLRAAKRAEREVPGVLVLPGLKAAPYYHWRGSYFDENLTAIGYNKQLIVLGLDSPGEIDALPVINGCLTTAHLAEGLRAAALFVVPLIIGIALVFMKGRMRWAGLVVAVLSILAILNERPLSPVRADPYASGPTLAPHQRLIDYVDEKRGLTFWVMPTSRAYHRLETATLTTEPHQEDLLETRGYTGFEALYGDVLKLHLPGSVWDTVLKQYLAGRRARPPFAIAGSDFWREGKSRLGFDQYQIVFPGCEMDKAAIINRLREGGVYARRKSADNVFPRLTTFEVSGATSGEEVEVAGPPVVEIGLAAEPGTGEVMSLTVVRGGQVIKKVMGRTPLHVGFVDRGVDASGAEFYRCYAQGPKGMFLISNPIFVRFK